MNIGFDAKRYFHNNTGLGNYSRTLVNGLAELYPEHKYLLFNPKGSGKFSMPAHSNIHEKLPQKLRDKLFSSLWRSKGVIKDLQQHNIHLYHGLSHEIPVGIDKTSIKSVVTIHDLIFERYPNHFNPIDVKIYRKKFKYASQHADAVIAISKQTRKDLIDFYKIDDKKIFTSYQSCDPAFTKQIDDVEKEKIRHQYNLPQNFILYVGSIIERKNLLGICKALVLMKSDISLVIIGNGKNYKLQVQKFINSAGMNNRVIFLSEKQETISDKNFQKPETFAAIYQMATALVYPSFYEGFGIPVLEALWSKVPVITSNTSCLPETGGPAALYVDPASTKEIADAMDKVVEDESLREKMKVDGITHAQNFTLEKCTRSVMEVYKQLFNERSV